MATTTNLSLNQPAFNSSAWDVPLNANETILDAAFGNTTSISLVASPVTLTSSQMQAMQIKFTGTISANIVVTIPALGGRWTFTNLTTGAFTVTLASAGGGTTLESPQGFSILAFSDGTNINLADDGLIKNGVLPALTVTGNSTLGSTGTTSTSVGGKLTLSTTTTQLSALVNNISETATLTASAANGTINYDITTQSVLYYTVNATANFTLNFRASSGTTLNTALSTGQAVTVVFLNTNGTTAYYNNALTIDGTSVTAKWQGGTAPTAGNVSSIDAYTYTIIKTASSTYVVLASQSQFK